MQQLVLQFSPWRSDTRDFDKLISLEEQLIDALAGKAHVDGHDVGTNEANLFIHTPLTPRERFRIPFLLCRVPDSSLCWRRHIGKLESMSTHGSGQKGMRVRFLSRSLERLG